MSESKLLITDCLGANKLEKEYYETMPSADNLPAMLADGRLDLARTLARRFGIRGHVLEMGSGHSWLTAEISKVPGVTEAWCTDISKKLLTQIAPQTFKTLGAKEEKITRVVGSFYHIPCPDNFFDFIIFESSFHHVPDYTMVFKELHRILKLDGVVLCTRERVIREGAHESDQHFLENKRDGILERIFTVPEYRYIAELNHFHFKAEPIFWYPDTGRTFKHWIKMIVSHLPVVSTIMANWYNSRVFILRSKAFK